MTRGADAFWLLTDPFEERPDVRFLIPTRPARTALAQLRHALAARPGWVVVLGDAGAGKSVLVQLFVEAWADETPVAVVADAGVDYASLSREIHEQLFDVAGGSLTHEALRVAERAGRRPVIVLDGAEDLSERTLRELEATYSAPDGDGPARLLVDFVTVIRRAPDQGAPEWARTRGAPVVCLEPLDANDTAEYVRRRIRLAAGGERELFDAGALDEVYRRTGGLPDAINRLCGLALDRVASAGGSRVGSEDVSGAAAVLGDLPSALHQAIADAEQLREPEPHRAEPPSAEPRAAESHASEPRLAEPASTTSPPATAPREAAPAPTRESIERPVAAQSDAPATRLRPPPTSREPHDRLATHEERTRRSPWVVLVAALGGALIGAVAALFLTGQLGNDRPDGIATRGLPAVAAAPPRARQPDARQVTPPSPERNREDLPDMASRAPERVEQPGPIASATTSTVPSAESARPLDPAVLPSVGAAPPPEASLPPVVPESAREPPPRVTLPLDQGAPTLDRAFNRLAPTRAAWTVEIYDPRSRPPRLIERVELAHDEIDGRLLSLGVLAGQGGRRPARLLDLGEDVAGRKARVFWPDERVVRLATSDDPFAGTGFQFVDLRPRRSTEFDVTAFEGDEIDGSPTFVITATPLATPAFERVEIVIAERDERVLEMRWFDAGSDTPARRLVMPRPGPGSATGDVRSEVWRLYGPHGNQIAQARIEMAGLPDEAGPELFTFSRLSDPGFSVQQASDAPPAAEPTTQPKTKPAPTP